LRRKISPDLIPWHPGRVLLHPERNSPKVVPFVRYDEIERIVFEAVIRAGSLRWHGRLDPQQAKQGGHRQSLDNHGERHDSKSTNDNGAVHGEAFRQR